MTDQRLPWSWSAFVVSCLALGAVLVAGVYLTQPFRQGLDADMGPMLWATPLWQVAIGLGLLALMGAPFVLVARWVANRFAHPQRMFVILLLAAPSGLMTLKRTWTLIEAALEPPMPVLPFEQDNIFYLPNWLEIGFVALAGFLAALLYLRISGAPR